MIAGAIIASRPQGSRGVPRLRPAGVWPGLLLGIPAGLRRSRLGRVAGYTGRPVQVCPGYVPPPPPAPGYAGSPPAPPPATVELPPK